MHTCRYSSLIFLFILGTHPTQSMQTPKELQKLSTAEKEAAVLLAAGVLYYAYKKWSTPTPPPKPPASSPSPEDRGDSKSTDAAKREQGDANGNSDLGSSNRPQPMSYEQALADFYHVKMHTKKNIYWGSSEPMNLFEDKFNKQTDTKHRYFLQWGKAIFYIALTGDREIDPITAANGNDFESRHGKLISTDVQLPGISTSKACIADLTTHNLHFFNTSSARMEHIRLYITGSSYMQDLTIQILKPNVYEYIHPRQQPSE